MCVCVFIVCHILRNCMNNALSITHTPKSLYPTDLISRNSKPSINYMDNQTRFQPYYMNNQTRFQPHYMNNHTA